MSILSGRASNIKHNKDLLNLNGILDRVVERDLEKLTGHGTHVPEPFSMIYYFEKCNEDNGRFSLNVTYTLFSYSSTSIHPRCDMDASEKKRYIELYKQQYKDELQIMLDERGIDSVPDAKLLFGFFDD